MITRPVPPSIVIASTMVIAFTLSVAFMLWQRSDWQRTPQTAVAATPPLLRTTLVNEPRPTIAPTTAPATALHADRGARADSGDDAPVLIVVRNRRRLDDVEATAKNTSDRPVSLTLALENGEGEIVSRARLELSPGEARRFGASDGIDLPRGGKIRVTMPGYVDRVVEIPL
jgi:hypothetical protein